MIILTPHDGQLGTSSWVDCFRCSHPPGLNWGAIMAGEPHFVDAATGKSYHRDCALRLVRRGDAEFARMKAAS